MFLFFNGLSFIFRVAVRCYHRGLTPYQYPILISTTRPIIIRRLVGIWRRHYFSKTWYRYRFSYFNSQTELSNLSNKSLSQRQDTTINVQHGGKIILEKHGIVILEKLGIVAKDFVGRGVESIFECVFSNSLIYKRCYINCNFFLIYKMCILNVFF